MSRIASVRVRKLTSKPYGYGHVAYEVEAEVGQDETPDQVADQAMAWIEQRIANDLEIEKLTGDLAGLRREVANETRRRDWLQREIEDGRKIIREHDKLAEIARREGIDSGALGGEELPF